MSANYRDPSDLRDKGLQFLSKGKEYFNKGLPDSREKGYELYKKGLSMVIDYLKGNFSLLKI